MCRSGIWFFLLITVKYIMRTFYYEEMTYIIIIGSENYYSSNYEDFGSSKIQSTAEIKKSRYVVGHPYLVSLCFLMYCLCTFNPKFHLQFSLLMVKYIYTFIGKYQTDEFSCLTPTQTWQSCSTVVGFLLWKPWICYCVSRSFTRHTSFVDQLEFVNCTRPHSFLRMHATLA